MWTLFPTYPYTCRSQRLDLAFASWLTVNDFMVLALPIFVVWRLQLPQRQRRTIIALLSLSLFACIAGVFRNVYIGYSVPTYDLLWTLWEAGVASVIEVNLGVVSSSFPERHVHQCLRLIN